MNKSNLILYDYLININPGYFNDYGGLAKQAVEVKTPTVVYEGDFTASGFVKNGNAKLCPKLVPVKTKAHITVKAHPNKTVSFEINPFDRTFGPYCFSHSDHFSIKGEGQVKSWEPLMFDWSVSYEADDFKISLVQSTPYGSLTGTFENFHRYQGNANDFSNIGSSTGEITTEPANPEAESAISGKTKYQSHYPQ